MTQCKASESNIIGGEFDFCKLSDYFFIDSVVEGIRRRFTTTLSMIWVLPASYNSHDLGSTRILITLLRPSIKCFGRLLSLSDGFEQKSNSVGKNSKKSTRTLKGHGGLILAHLFALEQFLFLRLISKFYIERYLRFPLFVSNPAIAEVGSASHKSCAASARATTLKILRR